MIYNIKLGTFGGPLRNGDIIGVANVITYLRIRNSDPMLQFHMDDDAVGSADYIQTFFKYIKNTTDFFTDEVGSEYLNWNRVNVWDFRDIAGDIVVIDSPPQKELKLVMVPVFDADYNQYRNWPIETFQKFVNESQTILESNARIILCSSKHYNIFPDNVEVCTNLEDTLEHIKTCTFYVGGDTGLTHFASVLDNRPKIFYINSSRALLHTLPFRWESIYNDTPISFFKYWLDFEGSNFQTS